VGQAEEIYVIASPDLDQVAAMGSSDVDGARVAADERLQRAFEHMHADGLKPKGSIDAENQVVAIIAERVRSHLDLPTVASSSSTTTSRRRRAES
jgi:predicted RNase H-like HicB family nuclease